MYKKSDNLTNYSNIIIPNQVCKMIKFGKVKIVKFKITDRTLVSMQS